MKVAGVVAGAVILMVPCGASAQDAERQACLDAAVHGQELLKSRHLVDAHAPLTQCASESCPPFVRRDCVRWLDEAQAAQPSIVLSAHDARGQDVVDARVTVDGLLIPDALAGKAFDVDPGEHLLHLERGGKPPFEQKVPVREGEKRQLFVLQLEPPATVNVPPPAAAQQRAGAPAATYVFAVTGVVASGLFGAFGIKGVVDRGDFHCDTGCPQSQRSQVELEFDVADVALGVGVVAFGVALWTFLARGYVKRSTAFFVQSTVGGALGAWQWHF